MIVRRCMDCGMVLGYELEPNMLGYRVSHCVCDGCMDARMERVESAPLRTPEEAARIVRARQLAELSGKAGELKEQK